MAALAVGCASTGATPLQRAALLTDRGQVDEAKRVLHQHLQEHPHAIKERQMLVRLHAVTGDLGAAKREAERLAQELGPSDPRPWVELGHAFELAHRYEAALAMFDRAAELAPKNPLGSRVGGRRAARWGEVEIAEPRLAEAVRRDPTDAATWHALGVVRLRLGNVAGAEQAYRSGLKADPLRIENRLGLATVALRRDRPVQVLHHYDRLLEARPRFAAGHLGRAWALIRLRRFDEAEAAITRGSELGAARKVVAKQRAWLRRERLKPRPR